MNYFENVKKELYKFENLGVMTSENGAILIGKANHVGEEAWLNKIYPILNDNDIKKIEMELPIKIPEVYKFFLLNYSNGLNVCLSSFYLDGLRKQLGRSIEASRQPYSIITTNTQEKPQNSKDNYFFIGGYNWDGSHLYIDVNTEEIHCCDRYDATSRYKWNSFEEMIVKETKRIGSLFDEKGIEIDEDVSTLPY